MKTDDIKLKGCFNCKYKLIIENDLYCDWIEGHKSVPFWESLEPAPVSTRLNGLRCTAWKKPKKPNQTDSK